MYNGIGLTTPRGSGTNGHVQRNLSSIRQKPLTQPSIHQSKPAQGPIRKIDESILLHQKKRQAEVASLELSIQLEKQGLSPEEIKTRCDALLTEFTSSIQSKE